MSTEKPATTLGEMKVGSNGYLSRTLLHEEAGEELAACSDDPLVGKQGDVVPVRRVSAKAWEVKPGRKTWQILEVAFPPS